MQAIDLLLTRRSARTLAEPAPDAASLELILASAVRAPDHGRLRPWRFVVVREAARAHLGALLAAHLQRHQAQVAPETLERERSKAFRAPLIVVVGAHVNSAVKIPVIEQVLAAGAAAEAMMLAAVALGFNAMWKTGAAAYDDTVKQALGFEPHDAIVGFLYLGTEAAPPAPEAPSPWQDLVRYLEDAAAPR
ncbi:MAG TPA: nitroreductase family protein [Steroidobacteraceae bacterium]|jgi:nitroreductase|nr:nitroreductase family protein [Steroidobacteraceae bacterium]